MEQSIIENEAQITRAHTAEGMQPSTGAIKKTASGVKSKKGKQKKRRPEWVSEVAADIEDQAVREVLAVEAEAIHESTATPTRRMRPGSASQQGPQQPPPREVILKSILLNTSYSYYFLPEISVSLFT